MAKEFANLGLDKWLQQALDALAISRPSTIQTLAIPPILKERDVMGIAPTGSGKTIAFAAPILQKFARERGGIFAVILTPTRELAFQIDAQLAALGSSINLKRCLVVGGMDMTNQALELQKCPHVVIATPGRLAYHIMQGSADIKRGLDNVKFLVLDEADRLLCGSFGQDINTCIDALPSPTQRQTLFFTATMTSVLQTLIQAPPREGKQPILLLNNSASSTTKLAVPPSLHQQYLFIPSHAKEAYLYHLLNNDKQDSTVIIFVNKIKGAEIICRMLRSLSHRVTALHSLLSQQERLNSLGRFRAGAARILVATDVASRGLDIPIVDLVINYDLPQDPDDYIHRVGRTARAGRKGLTISFVCERDIDRIQAIESRVHSTLSEYTDISENKVLENSLQPASIAKRQAILELERERFGDKQKDRKRRKINYDKSV